MIDLSLLKIDQLEVTPTTVLVVRDPNGILDEELIVALGDEWRAKHPDNLMLVLGGDVTIETLQEDELRVLLDDLIEQKRQREGE